MHVEELVWDSDASRFKMPHSLAEAWREDVIGTLRGCNDPEYFQGMLVRAVRYGDFDWARRIIELGAQDRRLFLSYFEENRKDFPRNSQTGWYAIPHPIYRRMLWLWRQPARLDRDPPGIPGEVLQAVREGDRTRLEELIEDGADLSAVMDGESRNLVHVAILAGTRILRLS